MSRIQNIAWVLPRPSKSKYKGSFPLHFESRLIDLLQLNSKSLVLQPFGGKSEIGIRLDTDIAVLPDIVADAHHLPFKDNTFDCVICDPPYSDKYARELYKSKNPKFKTYTTEAARVLKESGYLVLYHYLALPRIPNTFLVKRVFLETRTWHKLRCIHIYKKDSLRETKLPQMFEENNNGG